ncbi:MAG: argininosuccinate lyase, partial [Candidatus Binatia bacterium]
MVGDNKKGAKTRKAPSSRTWGGRFASATDAGAQAFTASIGFDLRLYPYDVRVSQAHARMLAASGIITSKE